ncbi:Latent-transforming growth factor beta-binding protein 4 [Holothuria leucospilota]|uniref:Latent-transforming growth factor beta-binding protein 4 n=1 Tax=Holothuria leucospilota TaxID=206669 RepID=A0A9Q1C1I0_HOLLE|nr:Latent-transforming growth factor beta-binding protein 4 [Holothuria leucospilota]
MEVFPENPNSYIVSPTTVDITDGAPAATVTVTVIDDSIDEGQYESFRIKIACINNGEYRVCDNNGVLLTDDRDIVYSCSYDIPEHSCKTSLCFCTFDDWVPEATETFYIFPIPPEVSSAAGQVLTVTIEDDDPSNDPSASIMDVTQPPPLDEDSGTTELVITASTMISGLFELKALYGTAELGVDYTLSGVTFSSETMATVTLTIIQDDVYEEKECVTLFPSTSPVELGSNVVPREICWDDTDEGIGLYPENVVGYIGCAIDLVIFSKTSKDSGDIALSSQVVNGLDDLLCDDLSPSTLTDGLGFSTLTCEVVTSATLLESHYEIEVTATGTGFTSKETATVTVKPFDTTTGDAYDSAGGTAVDSVDFTSSSGMFTLTASSDPDEETPSELTFAITTDTDTEIAEDFTVTFTDISEAVQVIILPDPDSTINILGTRGITATDNCDFMLVEDPQSNLVFVYILQDDEIEGIEEFVVFVECNVAYPTTVEFSATICIIDDDKEEKKDEVSTPAYQSTTDQASTTDLGSTTDVPSTTNVPSTTRIESTTNIPSTTKEESTTNLGSTTNVPSTTRGESTTKEESTTNLGSTTNIPSTTRGESTTKQESTTDSGSTTNAQSTTLGESTTEFRSTTNKPSTTNARSTTNMLSSTENPSTSIAQSTTDQVSTTLSPSTTARESTTESQSTTLGISTTFQSTTFESTTLQQSSTLEPTTTIMQTTVIVTTGPTEATTVTEGTTGMSDVTTRVADVTTREADVTTREADVTTNVRPSVTTEVRTEVETEPSTELTTNEVTTNEPTTDPNFYGNCLTGQFLCSDGVCIPGALLCDNLQDCSDDETNCEGACSAVMPPQNGFQTYSQTTGRSLYLEGMTISFECNTGYTLVGNAVLTCQDSDFGQVPECEENCPPPQNVDPNAIPSVVSSSFDHGSSIDYSCAAGYEGDPATITCNDGMWVGSFPVCTDICTEIQCHENGHCEIDDNNDPFCICNDGFFGNGVVCADIDECSNGEHDCQPPDVCINDPPGSFSCGNAQLIAFSLRRDNTSDYEEHVGYEPNLSELIPLPESFYVSILEKKHLLFTENGVISFLSEGMEPPNSFEFSNPVDLYRMSDPLVAAFWGSFISGQLKHRIYNSQNSEDKATLMVIGAYVREWDQSDFASNLPFIPTWAIVISWENLKHANYLLPGSYLQCALTTDGSHTFALITYQSVAWPVAEKLVLGYNSGTELFEIDQLDNVIHDEMGEPVYRLNKVTGNSNLPGRWVFRLDSNDPTNTNEKQSCVSIFTENLDDVLSLENVKECPGYISSMKGLQFDTCSFTLSSERDVTNYGRPKQSFCLSQKLLSTYPESSPGSYCWYDTNGYLMDTVSHRNVWESTVVQKIHPRGRIFQTESQQAEWIRKDVEFRYQCCIASNSDDHCDLYQSVRPSPSNGAAPTDYSPSGVYGAGHYVTFDGRYYTFNGVGEFILLRIEEAALEIQARSQVPKTIPRVNGTVITAIAIKLENDLLEFTAGSDGTTIKTFLNRVEITTDNLIQGFKVSERLSVSLGPDAVNHSRQVMDLVLLPSYASNVAVKIFLRMNIVSGSLNYLMTISENALQRGSTEGLLGVYNGDSSDDFLFPDGHRLIIEDGIVTDEDIKQFGESWRTTVTTSIFSYESNDGWNTYNDVDFSATFYEDLFKRSDLSSKVAQASETCNEIRECLYDFITLENRDIAVSTKYIHEIFQKEQRAEVNYPPRFVDIREVDGDSTKPGIDDDGVLLIEVGRTYKYSIETDDQNDDDTVIISLVDGPAGANIDEAANDCASQSKCDQICTDTPEHFVCSCRNGFELLPDGYSCQDIDECKRQESLCNDNSLCQNTEGSYRCICRPGYRLISNTLLCLDINECRNENPCDVNEFCVNEYGSYHCECQPGFIRLNNRCTDLNECLSPSLNDCHTLATCSNLIGSYQCTCNEGFEGNGRVCKDIEECRISPFFCHPRFDCENTEGSYICSCPTGFEGNGDDCFDIDECHLGIFNCAEHEKCVNRVGYYLCECDNGFSIDASGNCANINECNQVPSPCPTNSECVDSSGSFYCSCLAGYFKQNGECLSIIEECSSSPFCRDPTCVNQTCSCEEGFVIDELTGECIDLDECEDNSHDCDEEAYCTNIPGGYTCRCNEGYSGNGTLCEDQLECEGSNHCNANSRCQDLPGSYYCVCQDGYQGNGENCVGKHNCEEERVCLENFICIEEDPGYSCNCPNGFQVVDDNCVDIDECINSPCAENATCYNTEGSFYCSCPSGYFGDGRISDAGCQDINECQAGLAVCPDNSICENGDGIYNCYCREGFKLQGDFCYDIDECLEGSHDCDGNATCINLPATYTCRCNPGFFHHDIESQNGYATVGMCKDTNECKIKQRCAHLPRRSCLNRIGHYLCICEVGSYEDENGVCVDSNSIELRIEFSDIKGIRTKFAFELVNEGLLDALSKDIQNLFSRSTVAEYVHQVLVIDIIRSDNQMGLVTIRIDFDLKANMTIQTANTLFGNLLVGRNLNIVPPNSIVNDYSVFYAESNLCFDGRHECFERGYETCVPTGVGTYICEGCQFGYRLENGSCLSDPCITGSNDCSERFFDSCHYDGNGQFSCENCQSGFFLTETECVPDPCETGIRTCDKLNFRHCISDGNNQFHCETCKPGFELRNGACTPVTEDNPCITLENTCQERKFQTCVFDGDGEYHCENCLPGYRQESELCVADPCQVGQNDCRERNFERCRYELGGRYICEKCQAGYELQDSECIQKESPVRRYRGKMRIIAVNDSSSLATYSEEFAKTDTHIFKVYEYHICSIMMHVLSSQSYLRSQNYNDCFIYQYRNGSIIPYFAVEFLQNEPTSDLSTRLKEALVNAGQATSGGLILSNRDRSGNILVDTDSVEFVDTGTYGCNRNSICTNGGTCIEDSLVYEYHCRCPADFYGRFCQMVANNNQKASMSTILVFTEPPPATTVASTLLEGNEFPAWSVALLAVAAILSFCLCACCACLYLSSRRGVQRSKGVFHYRQPLQGMRESVPVRNRLIQARREGREVPCRNPLCDIDDDESSRLEARDQKKMQQLSDILNHAEFLNNRMRSLAENRRNDVVYNPYADAQREQASEFTRPHLVDGSEAKVPSLSARMDEYIALSESSSNSVFKLDGLTSSSESSF